MEEIESLASEGGRHTLISMDYGAPSAGPDLACDSMSLKRIYVDPDGRLSLCCQLSDYGFNTNDVVGDLHETSLKQLYPRFIEEMANLRARSAPPQDESRTVLDAFPCLRCARTQGKLDWLRQFPDNPWTTAMTTPESAVPAGVS